MKWHVFQGVNCVNLSLSLLNSPWNRSKNCLIPSWFTLCSHVLKHVKCVDCKMCTPQKCQFEKRVKANQLEPSTHLKNCLFHFLIEFNFKSKTPICKQIVFSSTIYFISPQKHWFNKYICLPFVLQSGCFSVTYLQNIINTFGGKKNLISSSDKTRKSKRLNIEWSRSRRNICERKQTEIWNMSDTHQNHTPMEPGSCLQHVSPDITNQGRCDSFNYASPLTSRHDCILLNVSFQVKCCTLPQMVVKKLTRGKAKVLWSPSPPAWRKCEHDLSLVSVFTWKTTWRFHGMLVSFTTEIRQVDTHNHHQLSQICEVKRTFLKLKYEFMLPSFPFFFPS